MKKCVLLIVFFFNALILLADSTVQSDYIFYSDGGDTLKFTLENNKIHLSDSLVLNYKSAKKGFYLEKIFDKEAYSHEETYVLYKKEYIIKPVFVASQIQALTLTVKTYFGKNRLVNAYTKKFSLKSQQTGKFILQYKLVDEYNSYEKYCGNDFDKERLPETAIPNEDFFPCTEIDMAVVQNNDNTLTIDPFGFAYFINAKKVNQFFGSSEFGACLHDYSYTHIKKVDAETINFFQYSSGDGGSCIICGKYRLVSKKSMKPILFNRILANDFGGNFYDQFDEIDNH